jgi:hypothetical protein
MKFPDGSTTPADLLNAKKAILTGVQWPRQVARRTEIAELYDAIYT